MKQLTFNCFWKDEFNYHSFEVANEHFTHSKWQFQLSLKCIYLIYLNGNSPRYIVKKGRAHLKKKRRKSSTLY